MRLYFKFYVMLVFIKNINDLLFKITSKTDVKQVFGNPPFYFHKAIGS